MRWTCAEHGHTHTSLCLAGSSPAAPLVSLFSGAVAGAAGTVASYPFDLLRTTLAAQGEPKVGFRNSSCAPLCASSDAQGISLFGSMTGRACQLVSLQARRSQGSIPLPPCPCGCLQVYHNMFDAAKGIVKARGVQGLYSGLGVTIIEIIPYAALQFGLYDALQAGYKRSRVGSTACQAWMASLDVHWPCLRGAGSGR